MPPAPSRVNLPTTTSSLFFRLPLELRSIIYSLLLTNRSDIFIPADLYKRDRTLRRQKLNQISSTGQDLRVPFVCNVSSKVPCPHQPGSSRPLHPSHNTVISETAILLTCRQINAEASPFLYQRNTFQFEDASIASSFRWSTSQAFASHICSLHVVYGPIYVDTRFNSSNGDRKERRRDTQWSYYLVTTERFSLRNDFPNLKYLTLTFGRGLETATRSKLMSIIEPWTSTLEHRLKWVQIIGLNDEILLSYLFPLVWPMARLEESNITREDSDHRNEPKREFTDVDGNNDDLRPTDAGDAARVCEPRARMHVDEYAARPGWKNAIIWWGTSATPPCEIRPFEGDTRWRRRLFRIDREEGALRRTEWCIRESFSPGLD